MKTTKQNEQLTYTDTIQNMMRLWKTKGLDIKMQLIRELELSKNNLNIYKQKVEIDKNTIILETDWKKLNDLRKEQGLSPITNEQSRKAYVQSQLVQETRNLNKLTLEYDTLMRIYEHAGAE